MSTHAQIKQKAKTAQKKRGGPTPYEQKMKRLLGSVHKVKKIKKKGTKIDHLSQNSVRTTPKANMNRVIAQIRTNAARKEYDANPPKYTGKRVHFDIMMVPMKKQHFPVYPSTRKGVSFEERRKQHTVLTRRERLYKTILNHDVVIPKRCIPDNHEIDIERHEVDQDYGDMDSLGDDYE